MKKEKAIGLLGFNNDDPMVTTKLKTAEKNKLRKWVAALRSGKYRQGQGMLYIPANGEDGRGIAKRTDRFCCLGVYCNVVQKIPVANLTQKGFPADIQVELPIHQDVQSALADLNDTTKSGQTKAYGFKTIASIIEAIWLTP